MPDAKNDQIKEQAAIKQYVQVQCPKLPDQSTMNMLIRANRFFEHAKTHAYSGQDFDRMIAIHDLDNAIEYLVRILIRHFDVEYVTGKNLNTSALKELMKELNRFFQAEGLPLLPYTQQINDIREQRNLVQHGMICPASDIKAFVDFGEKFISSVLERYFGLQKVDLALHTLIKDDTVREKLRAADKDIKEGKYFDAVVECRDAFDYSRFNHSYAYQSNVWNAPGMFEARRTNKHIFSWLEFLNDNVILSAAAVDMPRYYQYKLYIDNIPSEYWVERCGHGYNKRNEWRKEDADFCYSFVCDTVLQWENDELRELHKKEVEGKDDNCITEVEVDIENIKIRSQYPRRQCMYILDDTMAELFYVNSKEEVNRLKCAEEKECVWWEITTHDRFVGAEKDGRDKVCKRHQSKQLIKIHGIDTRVVINNPATWEVYLSYSIVPFTQQVIFDRNVAADRALGVKVCSAVDIDGEDAEKSINSFDEIRNLLPLQSFNDALKLQKALEGKEIEASKWYSSKLIKKLTRNDEHREGSGEESMSKDANEQKGTEGNLC